MSARPRAFEPQRVVRALRANTRVLVGVTVLALFAGAGFARVAIPNEIIARASARIARDPHIIVSRARSQDVLEEARKSSAHPESVSALRDRLRLHFRGPDALTVELFAPADEAQARRFVDALVAIYVDRANARVERDARELGRARDAELAALRAEHDVARAALASALTGEGYPDLGSALSAERLRLEALVREAEEAAAQAEASQGKLSTVQTVSRERPTQRARSELAEAQRTLSRLLAQYGQANHPDVRAAQQALERLQAQTFEVTNAALKQRLEAQALTARARELAQRVAQHQAELDRLQRVGARVAPLVNAEARARDELRKREAEPLASGAARSEVTRRAEVYPHQRQTLRVLASLLAPLVALLSLLSFFALRQLRAFRVCAPSELAYWLDAPVLASSSWPRTQQALETLVDELADPALAARGIVLLLPLTELERPLATTLAAKLNARAQRQYRSTTGSRVTIAQPWIGELGSSRIRRAAEAADRVLWVVAADAHRGGEIRRSRELVGRREGVAAVLVDAEPSFGPRIGSAREFWSSRANVLTARVASR
jgi:hypothetical protein